MGIDIDGGMIVGALGEDICKATGKESYEIYDWLIEELEWDSYSPYFDADPEDVIYGFVVDDVLVDKIDTAWLDDIKEKGNLFNEVTGVDAELIGMANVW